MTPGADEGAGETLLLAEVTNLSAGYGSQTVLQEVGFRVEPGARIGVLGPNGGGKSTLFKVLLGELRPVSGSVQMRTRCGYVPQTERSRLDYPVSALDVALMGNLSRIAWWKRPGRGERLRALEALEKVGLRELASRSFGELSGGQRQRVLVARALVQDARLLLLDEPFNGLDGSSVERLSALMDQLAEEGRSLMVAVHDIHQARGWDLVLCLNGQQVAFGPPETTLTPEVLEATYGDELVMVPGKTRGQVSAELSPKSPNHHERSRNLDE